MAGAFEYKHLKNFLKIWGNEVVNEAKKRLNSAGKGGGDLEKSIKSEVKATTDAFLVEFSMANYGTFVDKGVKGAGGEIKTGEFKGNWGGRRWFMNYKGKRQDSPYQFGTGSGGTGGMRTGIEAFVKKKGLTPTKGTVRGLEIAIMKVLWVKGIHGIGFFQNSLMVGLSSFKLDMAPEVKEDIIDTLVTFPNITRA
mgnify:CR=1 FL=1|tara:strand:- start:10 stop:597 length:588 start_codon:yes stop_codon:yes gene_type:complete